MRGDEQWLDIGRNSSLQNVADFFRKDFDLIHKTTRASIVTKLNSFLNLGVLDKVLCGRTSIDLETQLNQRKVILVNLAKGRINPAEANALGTLLISAVQAIAMKRVNINQNERPMTHLIVDECQNFITGEIKTIIREARKFGLSITLAQQSIGAEMPVDLEKTVVSTTNEKVVGRSDIGETTRSGNLVGVDAGDIQSCEAGQFYYQAGTSPAFKLRVRSDRIGNKGGVDASTWKRIQEQQRRFFYRDILSRPPNAAPPDTPPAVQRLERSEQDKSDKPSNPQKYTFE